MIKVNPCIGIELSKIERKKDHETWDTNQIKNLLNYELVKNSKWYTLILLSVSTGMRPGEICGVKWENLEGKTLNVLTVIDTKRRDTDLKNDNSFNRKLYLGENLINALIKQKKWHLENNLLFGKDYIFSDFIFTHENGRVINPDNYGKTFKKLIKLYNKNNDISLPEISLYGT